MFDFNEAGDYILKESYARNVRDKIGDGFKEIPSLIKVKTQETFIENKSAMKDEIFAELAPSSVNAEVANARNGRAQLGNRLDDHEVLINQAAPAGSIQIFAGNTAPKGWLMAQGQQVSKTQYKELYGVIGDSYGTAASGYFYLPNLKGRIPVGLDLTQSEFNSIGKSGGSKTHMLTEAEMPAHSHRSSDNKGYKVFGGDYSTGAIVAGTGFYSSMYDIFTAKTGSDLAHNNLQPYITLNYIIKY